MVATSVGSGARAPVSPRANARINVWGVSSMISGRARDAPKVNRVRRHRYQGIPAGIRVQDTMIFFPGQAYTILCSMRSRSPSGFLIPELPVHPDVVRYHSGAGQPGADRPHHRRRPGGCRGGLGKAYPGHECHRDGMRFLTDPTVEIVWGAPVHREASTAPRTTSTISGTGTAVSAG